MVLKGTYGEKIHRAFRMTRQGVRWRFWRLLNDIYVSAFETVLFVETVFGTELRDYALRISRERHALREEMMQCGFRDASSLQYKDAATESGAGREGRNGQLRDEDDGAQQD